MPIKKMVLGITVLLIAVFGLLALTGMITNAQGADDQAVLSKLSEILSNQKVIMDDIAAMKEELRIIKIRVTQQQ